MIVTESITVVLISLQHRQQPQAMNIPIPLLAGMEDSEKVPKKCIKIDLRHISKMKICHEQGYLALQR